MAPSTSQKIKLAVAAMIPQGEAGVAGGAEVEDGAGAGDNLAERLDLADELEWGREGFNRAGRQGGREISAKLGIEFTIDVRRAGSRGPKRHEASAGQQPCRLVSLRRRQILVAAR